MTQRWGHDQEERSAVAKKAQDAYAAGRQAIERCAGLEGVVALLREDLAEVRRANAALNRRVDAINAESLAEPKRRKAA
jgi:hypothetical protein